VSERVVVSEATFAGSVTLVDCEHYGGGKGWAARADCPCGWIGPWQASKDDRCSDAAQRDLDEHRAAAHPVAT
jgi:hypothetical protein